MKWTNEMKKIILNFPDAEKTQLKRRGILVPTSNNHLFDILAERATEYYINIPKSKYHKLTICEVPFNEFYPEDSLIVNMAQSMNITCKPFTNLVWGITYNQNKFPNLTESYLKNYLLKQLEK